MSTTNQVGNRHAVKPQTTPNLINTDLFELITPASHGTDFSFNVMKLMPGGSVKSQSHPEQHAVLILNGRCKILMGEDWVNVGEGNYLYIPADLTHAFSNEGDIPVEILILKK